MRAGSAPVYSLNRYFHFRLRCDLCSAMVDGGAAPSASALAEAVAVTGRQGRGRGSRGGRVGTRGRGRRCPGGRGRRPTSRVTEACAAATKGWTVKEDIGCACLLLLFV